MGRKFKTRKKPIRTPVNKVYLQNPVGSKEWTILQKIRMGRETKDTKSKEKSITYNKRWWLERDDEYVMSRSERLTKYGDCG
jgi:hypothetical protein